jgi:hypothetical protein
LDELHGQQVPIVYGVVDPINTFNPLETNVINWRYIGANLRRLNGTSSLLD